MKKQAFYHALYVIYISFKRISYVEYILIIIQTQIQDIKSYGEITDEIFPYPIIEDESRKLATMLGMLDPAEVDSQGLPLSARAVFIIDPAKKMRLSILYPATTGRNFEYVNSKKSIYTYVILILTLIYCLSFLFHVAKYYVSSNRFS